MNSSSYIRAKTAAYISAKTGQGKEIVMEPKSQSVRAQLHKLEHAEMWLIRSGQHVFKEWRDKGRVDNALEESFECIWQLKREIRVDKRKLLAKR